MMLTHKISAQKTLKHRRYDPKTESQTWLVCQCIALGNIGNITSLPLVTQKFYGGVLNLALSHLC